MTAFDYPVTQPFGYDPTYPLNNGQHRGVDYGCPIGTPVIVNGVTIGLSGNTGAVTGPHLHVGRFVAGSATDPGKGGAQLDNATVFDTGFDNLNGNYVRVNGSGALWVYLHLSQINVKAGQRLEGSSVAEPIIENTNEARMIALEYGIEIPGNDPFLGRAVGQTELAYRTSLGPTCSNTIQHYKELAANSSGGEYVKVTDLYIKK